VKKENNIPLLSVCLITYNHVKYIAQAIDGVLMQKVNFAWELIIADDYSTDGTRDILISYQKKHPEFIKLILQKKNVGAYRNWMDMIAYPQGQYIAYLDGDDYWTDPLKLQKQVDFLEANPEFVICGHHTNELFNDTLRAPLNLGATNNGVFTIEDLAKGNLVYSPSVVYRNGLIEQLPPWFENASAGDYALHMLNARKGKIKYLPDTMAVYRIHTEGAWAAQGLANIFEKTIHTLSLLLTEEFNEKVIERLKVQRYNMTSQYLILLLETDPELFKTKLEALTVLYPELGKEWLLNSFINDHLELKDIKNRFNNLKNSRLRKYLSHIFKQLKI
jgi:glycosyltransferase involved in cell wall biosynthesis